MRGCDLVPFDHCLWTDGGCPHAVRHVHGPEALCDRAGCPQRPTWPLVDPLVAAIRYALILISMRATGSVLGGMDRRASWADQASEDVYKIQEQAIYKLGDLYVKQG